MSNTRRRNAQRRKPQPTPTMSPWRAYGLGLASGLVLALLIYLFTVPASSSKNAQLADNAQPEKAKTQQPPKAEYIFYDHLAKQPVTPPPNRTPAKKPQAADANMHYLLQAGSFRQAKDADRRRAELLLLGLKATVEEVNNNSGRLYRVRVGPFNTRAELSKARRLTEAQQIDTLILKRPRG